MLLAAVPAASQESPLPDLFSDVLDVRVVNVEVVVTDDDGYRIPGLEPSDFELLVDGETVPIDGQWKNEVEFRISVVDKYGDRSRNLGSRNPDPLRGSAASRRNLRLRNGPTDPKTRAPFPGRGLRPSHRRDPVVSGHRRGQVGVPGREPRLLVKSTIQPATSFALN